MDLFNFCMDVYKDCMTTYNELVKEEQPKDKPKVTWADTKPKKVTVTTPAKSAYGIPEIHTIGINEKKGTIVVVFADGTKTISKCAKGDHFDVNVGVAMAITEKMFGSKSKYHDMIKAKSPKAKILSEEMAELRAKQHDLESQLNAVNKTIRKKRAGK